MTKRNPAREALTRAVNKAIADGAPVYISMPALKGYVLWACARDGNGIIKDANGSEYYFDVSVCASRVLPKSGDEVSFAVNREITDCLCAREVRRL